MQVWATTGAGIVREVTTVTISTHIFSTHGNWYTCCFISALEWALYWFRLQSNLKPPLELHGITLWNRCFPIATVLTKLIVAKNSNWNYLYWLSHAHQISISQHCCMCRENKDSYAANCMSQLASPCLPPFPPSMHSIAHREDRNEIRTLANIWMTVHRIQFSWPQVSLNFFLFCLQTNVVYMTVHYQVAPE